MCVYIYINYNPCKPLIQPLPHTHTHKKFSAPHFSTLRLFPNVFKKSPLSVFHFLFLFLCLIPAYCSRILSYSLYSSIGFWWYSRTLSPFLFCHFLKFCHIPDDCWPPYCCHILYSQITLNTIWQTLRECLCMWKNPISEKKRGESDVEDVIGFTFVFSHHYFYFLREREWRERETDG